MKAYYTVKYNSKVGAHSLFLNKQNTWERGRVHTRKQVFKATHNYLTDYKNEVKLKTAVHRLLFTEDCCFYFGLKKNVYVVQTCLFFFPTTSVGLSMILCFISNSFSLIFLNCYGYNKAKAIILGKNS